MLELGQIRVLKGWRLKAESSLDTSLESDRFQKVFRDKKKKEEFIEAYGTAISAVLTQWFSWMNPFKDDSTSVQTRFEPVGWAEPIANQIETLGVYLTGIQGDSGYLQKRLNEELPEGFVRVAVPKLAFLQTRLLLQDVYIEIGQPIEHVCEALGRKHGKKFKNCREGELGPKRVRCNEVAMARRKAFEETVPGDIIILDVDLANLTLSDKKLCHMPRWSREEITHAVNLLHLSSVDIGWILVVNPKRLVRDEDLAIDATLEEYCLGSFGWVNSLIFYFHACQLLFGNRVASNFGSWCAAGVARLPGVK